MSTTPATPAAALSPRLVEMTFAVLATWFLAGAYLAARDSIRPLEAPTWLGAWQQVYVDTGWVAMTLFLLGVVAVNRRRGLALARALPDGYDTALAACVLFAMGVVLDPYWRAAFGSREGLENLLAPMRLIAVVAGIVLVATPLRAALARRDGDVGAPALVSAALVLSAIMFATQFAHPAVDPWTARGVGLPPVTPGWVADDLAVAALTLQSTITAAMVLVVVRNLRLPPLGLTVILSLNALFVALLKDRPEFVPGALLTGLGADLLRARFPTSPETTLPMRALAAAVAALYAGAAVVTALLVHGTAWRPAPLVGAVVLAATLGWLLSFVGVPVAGRGRSPVRAAAALVAVNDVKLALESLHDSRALAQSPLTRLPCLSGPAGEAPAELRALLVEVVTQIASSRSPRDAESGRILLDYYVRRIGSHEVVMEPMHVSKQTYFRRLDKGKALVAERLDELSEHALTSA